MLREPSFGGSTETDAPGRFMYRSTALITGLDNPRLYKALVDHFASLYPVSSKTNMAEFNLGGGQTFRLMRATNELTFEVFYSEISRFASVTRSLNSRTKKYAQGAALQWNTSRVSAPKQLLNLPRPLDESRAPEDVLTAIFHLDLNDAAESERRITACIDALYPSGPRLNVEHRSNDGQTTLAHLADWLSFQDASGVLEIEDPDHAATMLVSMMFGGLASQLSAGQGLPDRANLTAYLKSCIHLFVRGCRRRETH